MSNLIDIAMVFDTAAIVSSFQPGTQEQPTTISGTPEPLIFMVANPRYLDGAATQATARLHVEGKPGDSMCWRARSLSGQSGYSVIVYDVALLDDSRVTDPLVPRVLEVHVPVPAPDDPSNYTDEEQRDPRWQCTLQHTGTAGYRVSFYIVEYSRGAFTNKGYFCFDSILTVGSLSPGADGYYHPSTEQELQTLVSYAYQNGTPLRVRGSAHSVTQAIYTDGYDGAGAPPAGVIEVMLDKYRRVVITPDASDPGYALVEVEAGCNLGKNPYDPTGTSTWANSLDDQLEAAGYALDDTGGITHQTISGFMSTGSSGGSLTYAFEDNLVGITLIDGTGKVWDLGADDPATQDMFSAAGVSMGLLGIISRVRLRVGPTFNIYGTEVTSETAETGIDLFGPGGATPSLGDFFRRTPYTRLMWWPQHGLDRMTVWQAARTAPVSGFVPQPYLELGEDAQLAALAGSFFYTLIGNLDDVSAVPKKLTNWYAHIEAWLRGDPDPNACAALAAGAKKAKPSLAEILRALEGPLEKGFRKLAETSPEVFRAAADEAIALAGAREVRADRADLPGWQAALIVLLVELLLGATLESEVAQRFATWLSGVLPYLIPFILEAFVTNGTKYFWDSWRCGLPMDNQMDDQLWDTEFTELWIPLDSTPQVMDALRTFYAAGGDPVAAYPRTGAFSCEIYAAGASRFWMSPSYGTPVIRIDVFWFGLNAGSPDTSFYRQFWDLLEPFHYRPHWGKHLGPAANYLPNLPKLGEFLALRAQLDPKGIFLTPYWRDALGITE